MWPLSKAERVSELKENAFTFTLSKETSRGSNDFSDASPILLTQPTPWGLLNTFPYLTKYTLLILCLDSYQNQFRHLKQW